MLERTLEILRSKIKKLDIQKLFQLGFEKGEKNKIIFVLGVPRVLWEKFFNGYLQPKVIGMGLLKIV